MKAAAAYLSFDGNCRQAMALYRDCLAAELEVNPHPDANGQPTTDPGVTRMHARLVREGMPILMASDTPQAESLHPGSNFSVCIDCESLDEAERLIAALSRGGEVRLPLMNAPWGARFGMLTDQFGTQWMFNRYLPAR